MKKSGEIFALILSAVSTLGLLGCTHDNTDRKANPIVGAWFVKDPGAPFPDHMYVFNADGTMQQFGSPTATGSRASGLRSSRIVPRINLRAGRRFPMTSR